MSLQCGIVGLPNVGKSTLFNALSNAKAEAANYPFCTIEPNVGVVNVPDPRLQVLARLVNPKRVLPAIIEFVDIAGLVKGASRNEGRGNAFLASIREVDAIVHVVRCFDDDNVIHVAGGVDPVFDKEVIDYELQQKDLESITKRIARLERAAKSGDAASRQALEVCQQLHAHLEQGRNARTLPLTDIEWRHADELHLLTRKPVIYVANVDEASAQTGNAHVEALRTAVADEQANVLVFSAAIEAQIAEIEDPEERQLFLEEYGLAESGLHRLIRACFELLQLITYFTAGEQEVRAWTIRRGWKAPQAAGVIHSDFERGFIKAEVIKLDNFEKYGSEAACREVGKVAIEGKEYEVADGDVMHFRFNV